MYPGHDGEFRLYEDDGKSLDYLKGKFAQTRMRWDDMARKLTIEPDGPTGDTAFATGPRTFVVELAGTDRQQTVKYAGTRVVVTME